MVLLVLRQSTGTPKLLPSLVNPLVANWRRKGGREGGEGGRKGEREEREGGREREREGGRRGRGGREGREGRGGREGGMEMEDLTIPYTKVEGGV